MLAAAAEAPAAVLAARDAKGSATALHSTVLRVDGVRYPCCCLQDKITLSDQFAEVQLYDSSGLMNQLVTI